MGTGTKRLAGEEDLLLGQGQVEQTRKGQVVVINKVNSGSIPFQGEPGDANYKSVKTIIDELLVEGSEGIVEW